MPNDFWKVFGFVLIVSKAGNKHLAGLKGDERYRVDNEYEPFKLLKFLTFNINLCLSLKVPTPTDNACD